jgi:hypothetical protein
LGRHIFFKGFRFADSQNQLGEHFGDACGIPFYFGPENGKVAVIHHDEVDFIEVRAVFEESAPEVIRENLGFPSFFGPSHIFRLPKTAKSRKPPSACPARVLQNRDAPAKSWDAGAKSGENLVLR